jgi:hypothetical protein
MFGTPKKSKYGRQFELPKKSENFIEIQSYYKRTAQFLADFRHIWTIKLFLGADLLCEYQCGFSSCPYKRTDELLPLLM